MKTIKKVPLGEIDLSDETFSVNFMPDLRRLQSSIKEWGLIQPVLLRKKPGKYQIVCGFRRISVFGELGDSEIESIVFSEGEINDLHLFSIALHENLTTRGLNTVEKAIALDKLVHRFRVDRGVVIETFLPLFSLETHEKILNTYLALARMEDGVKEYVLKGEVSRSNIRILSTFSSEDRTAILSFLAPLKLTENRLREMLTLLEEISRRDRYGVKEIVRRPEMEAIFSQSELTPSQRTDRVKKVLTGLRYPKMTRLEEEFDQRKIELNLPSTILLRHPPFFEGRGLKIEFQFETVAQYRSIISSLSEIADREGFEKMVHGERQTTNVKFQNSNDK